MQRITLYLLSFLASVVCMPSVANGMSPVAIDSIRFDRHGDYMVLHMNMDLTPTKVSSIRAQVMTPLIVSETNDTLALPPVGVYGRVRYANYLRNGRNPLGASDEEIIQYADRPSSYSYEQTVPWEKWMDNSQVMMRRCLYGCTDCLLEDTLDPITNYFAVDPSIPEIVYFPAVDEPAKVETLEGSAFIDFVVNKTEIHPDYRNNFSELSKIRATIDSVVNDRDVTVTEIWLKGYASPESPYSHNSDLAKGRTASLKHYIRQLYSLPEDVMKTDFEPEDWAGLRRHVEESNIDNKLQILDLIDSDMEPDAKEAKIRSSFPEQYKFMLLNFYPALRHTDYRISYEIKRFDDLEKIREVFFNRPSRLSLREFFLLGNSYEPGSNEFNDVYETAVRMYPDNEVANINAANAALQRCDYVTAERYLENAGSSPEAVYARGALAFLRGDYVAAETLMKQASSIPASQSTLNEINRIRSHSKSKIQSITLK